MNGITTQTARVLSMIWGRCVDANVLVFVRHELVALPLTDDQVLLAAGVH